MSPSVCLFDCLPENIHSQKVLKKKDISAISKLGVMKFGWSIDVGWPKVDLEGQRSLGPKTVFQDSGLI